MRMQVENYAKQNREKPPKTLYCLLTSSSEDLTPHSGDVLPQRSGHLAENGYQSMKMTVEIQVAQLLRYTR